MGILIALYAWSWLALFGGFFKALFLIVPMTFGFVAWFVWSADREAKLNNYDMSKVSIGRMTMDATKSPREIQNNLIAGKYNKNSKWKI